MSANDGVRWYCPNQDCNWSFVATALTNDAAPHCICGRQMKRDDTIPAFHYLDFLREGVAGDEELGVEKE
jgi:hypothetical protein